MPLARLQLPQVDANPEVREAAMQEMVAVTHEMQAVLRAHRVSHPKMLLLMFGQAPVFISLFIATREVRMSATVSVVAFPALCVVRVYVRMS